MTTINLPDDLVEEAKRYANAFSRSTPKQIEHWSKIGKIAEENPDLSYEFICEILLSMAEKDLATPFEFSEIRKPEGVNNEDR